MKRAPVAEWIVIFEDEAPIFIGQHGVTLLGSAAGWTCVASLASETRKGKRVDVFTVGCTKDGVEVRTRAHLEAGAPHVAWTPLQISYGTQKRPIVNIAFGSRPRSE